MIQFECGHCEKTITADDSQAGKAVKCPSCGQLTLAETGEGTSAKIITAVPPPPPSAGRGVKSGLKRPGAVTASAKASLVMGILSLLLPIVIFFAGWQYMCFLVLAELICTIGAGICGAMAVMTPGQSRQGKKLALTGMIMCLVIMLPLSVIYILNRLGYFILSSM